MTTKIDRNDVPQNLRRKIEGKIETPQDYPGLVFCKWVWIDLKQIITKNSKGSTDNNVRISGTGDNDTLLNSLKGGMDLKADPISVIPNGKKYKLINGFNRVKALRNIKYTTWIFAVYEDNQESRTVFQKNLEDVITDVRFSMNKDDGKKPHTEIELREVTRSRFEYLSKEKQTQAQIITYLKTLDHNFSQRKISGIASSISKELERKGIIESYNDKEGKQFISDIGIGAELMNCHSNSNNKANDTLILRTGQKFMKNYVQSQTTMDVAVYDSQASCHSDLYDHRKNALIGLNEFDTLVLEYASARMLNPHTKPFNVVGAIPQAIGEEDYYIKNKKIVPIETT